MLMVRVMVYGVLFIIEVIRSPTMVLRWICCVPCGFFLGYILLLFLCVLCCLFCWVWVLGACGISFILRIGEL